MCQASRVDVGEDVGGGSQANVCGKHSQGESHGDRTCGVEVSFDGQGDRDALIEQASDLLEPHAQGFAHIEDGDDLEIQVYLSRQGTSLPTEG
jgi:hypothetical protein